jgi:SAM-dependent methyltransferase
VSDVDYLSIYRNHAGEYDRLVSAEDFEGALLQAIRAVVPELAVNVLEIGVGTGRLARLLVPWGARVIGVDRSPGMLSVARRRLEPLSGSWQLAAADMAELPIPSGWADFSLAGWVFGHQSFWFPQAWRSPVGAALAEMARATRPGGTMLLFETLGTGRETPHPPAELRDYYAWLEKEEGFQRRELCTDYLFADLDEAEQLCGLFFGVAFAEQIRRERWQRVPECTGMWWKRRTSQELSGPEGEAL